MSEIAQEEPVVFLHGFDGDALISIIQAIKQAAPQAGIDPASIAFSSSTPTNRKWKIKDLIREVRQEHEYFRAHPPVKKPEN
ncbi:MAG: DUF3783 domain-containing protein [Treponema sp.]|nr:DUF3783 domain-containing protein [Treponema sp.]